MIKVSELYRGKYMKSSDLKGETWPVRIKDVKVEEFGEHNEEKQGKYVVYFQNHERPLVLNWTNASLLSSHFGDNPDEWLGRTIELFCERVLFKGDRVAAIRVRIPPKSDAGAAVQVRKSPAPVTAGTEDLNDDISF
jgi:hypothetical protein